MSPSPWTYFRRCATALALVLAAAGSASARVTLGPTVAPRGPGRVTVVWEGSETDAVNLLLTASGHSPRVITTTGANGLHQVEVNGLDPGVEYHYRVSDRSGRFIAPPDAGQEVRFAVYGDSRTGDAIHSALVEQIIAERPDFYLMTGDVVPDGESMDLWRTFFAIESPLMATTPFVTARGNHDGPTATDDHETLFEKLVKLRSDAPGNTPTYGSLDLGPGHFLVLDSEVPLGPGSLQYAFAERDLAAHRTQPLFAVLHRPLYSSGRHGSDEAVRAALGPLFQRYGVDLVFQGHDHHYERTRAINGVTYVVTGGAGAPLFGVAGSSWSAAHESVSHYLMVESTATRIHVVARRLDGTVLDRFEIDPHRNDRGEFAGLAAPVGNGGGGGCAMIFLGRGRRSARGALGAALVPLLGVVAARGARRRARNRRAD